MTFMLLPLGCANLSKAAFAVAVLLLGGCSDLPYFLGLEPTGLRYDGSYTPYAAERAYDCPELRLHVVAEEQRLIGADERALAEAGKEITTFSTLFSRASGKSVSNTKAVQEYNANLARLHALEDLARAKGCPDRMRSSALQVTEANLARLIREREARAK